MPPVPVVAAVTVVMGNSISLNVLADEGHLTLNSQRSQFGSPLVSPRSDDSSNFSRATSNFSDSDLDAGVRSQQDCSSTPVSPCPKTRQCWICYGEEEISDQSDFQDRWVAPCKCKGTTKWVHQACLLDWIDSQVFNDATLASNRNSPTLPTATPTISPALQGNNQPAPRFQAGDGPLVLESVNLSCPQCHAPYKITEAHALPRRVLLFIDWMARVKERSLLWSTIGLVSGSIYTIAFSYGLFSGWIVGGKEYLEFIRDTFINGNLLNRLQISAGLPLTPLFALSATFPIFSWTYPLVPLFLFDGQHRVSITQPRGILLFLPLVWSSHRLIINSLIPTIYKQLSKSNDLGTDQDLDQELNQDQMSRDQSNSYLSESLDSLDSSESGPNGSTVKISILSTTGALLFPSVSALTGWLITALLPKSISSKISPFNRSLIGAGVLIALKDLSKLLYWYQTVKLRKYRRVLNRTE